MVYAFRCVMSVTILICDMVYLNVVIPSSIKKKVKIYGIKVAIYFARLKLNLNIFIKNKITLFKH